MKKRKKGSLSIRLFSTIFIVIVLLNLLSIIGALSLSRSSRDNMIQEHRYLQQSYIDQLDRELEQAQIRMYDLSRSRLFFQTFSDDQEGADEYEKLRHQVELNNEINEWLGTFPLIDGYYIYDPDSETLIICGNDSGVILGISDSIKNLPVHFHRLWPPSAA